MEKLRDEKGGRNLARALLEPEKIWLWIRVEFHHNLWVFGKLATHTTYWIDLDSRIREEVNGNGFAPNDPCTIPLPPGTIERLQNLFEILDESVAVIGYTLEIG